MHLLKPRESGSPNMSQLRFELGLRSYMTSVLKKKKEEGNSETLYRSTDKRPPWRYLGTSKPTVVLSNSDSI